MSDNEYSLQAVTAAISGDADAFQSAFNNAIAAKVTDALELKKVEIASNFLNTEEVPNEVQQFETEVDGSADATADSAATATAEAE
jgi:hypothetical protein